MFIVPVVSLRTASLCRCLKMKNIENQKTLVVNWTCGVCRLNFRLLLNLDPLTSAVWTKVFSCVFFWLQMYVHHGIHDLIFNFVGTLEASQVGPATLCEGKYTCPDMSCISVQAQWKWVLFVYFVKLHSKIKGEFQCFLTCTLCETSMKISYRYRFVKQLPVGGGSECFTVTQEIVITPPVQHCLQF